MKKFLKKHGLTRCISATTGFIGIILFIVAAFLKNSNVAMTINVIGFLIFLISGLVFFIKSKKNNITKLLIFLAFVVVLMSWIMPYGIFQGVDFYDNGMNRIGLGDIGQTLFAAIYWSIDKILFLIVLSIFYSVLSKTPGYKALVNSIAKKLKKHEFATAIVMSLIIVILTSFLNQSFVVLVFIPFMISILLNMNIDKLTTFAITFGSVLVGLICPLYGTESLFMFNHILNLNTSTGIVYRLIILLVSFFLYSFFICFRLKKVLKEKNNEDISDVAFAVTTDSKKGKKTPIVILFVFLFVITILGFINWKETFNIDCFEKFHKWLTGLSIGKDFHIFAYILGSLSMIPEKAKIIGSFDLISMVIILLILTIIVAVANKVKLSNFFETVIDGIKQMVLPVTCLVGVYFVFSLCSNVSPFMTSISNWALNLTDGLNPYITTILGFITSIFHVEAGFTAYSIGSFLTHAFADNLSIAHTIYLSTYGLVQVFMPTSIIMLIGLKLMNIDYKSWFKYIWLFVLSIFIILLVLFTVLVYI